MQQRYRLFRRGWGVYYAEDTATGKQESLGTADKDEAKRLVHARNEGAKVGGISREIAGAYLKASDPSYMTRTWAEVMDAIFVAKSGDTQVRWAIAIGDRSFDLIRHMPLMATRAEHFMEILRKGTVSTNVFLRRLHNFALDMGWLLQVVLPKRQWPKPNYKPKRGTSEFAPAPQSSHAAQNRDSATVTPLDSERESAKGLEASRVVGRLQVPRESRCVTHGRVAFRVGHDNVVAIMVLYRHDKDGELWARQIGTMGKELNLTRIAVDIKARAIPDEEIEAEILSHVDSSVVKDDVLTILAETLKELASIRD